MQVCEKAHGLQVRYPTYLSKEVGYEFILWLIVAFIVHRLSPSPCFDLVPQSPPVAVASLLHLLLATPTPPPSLV